MGIQLPDWLTTAGGGRAARLVDLSHPLTGETPVYPGDPEPRIFPATTVAGEGYNLSHVHLGTQTGTHVDAPFHFRDDGATIDRLPLDLSVGPGVVIRVPERRAGEQVGLREVEPYLSRLGPGRIPLFATGWYRHAGTARFFEHPYLSVEVGEALLTLGVRTIAIDTLNADFTGGDRFPIHEMVADAGGLIAENLAGTDALTPGVDPLLVLLPLDLVGCDGAPIRAVAIEPPQA